jgi:hypothetical protein
MLEEIEKEERSIEDGFPNYSEDSFWQYVQTLIFRHVRFIVQAQLGS